MIVLPFFTINCNFYYFYKAIPTNHMTEKEELTATSRSLRGTVIDEWIYLEKAIERFIVNHLSSDKNKRYEIMGILTDRLSFESKRQAFKSILDGDDDIESDHKKGKKRPHAELIEEIRKVNIDRNNFAHYYLDNSADAVILFKQTGEVSFFEMRDKPIKKTYTKEKFLDLINRIQACTHAIVKTAVK